MNCWPGTVLALLATLGCAGASDLPAGANLTEEATVPVGPEPALVSFGSGDATLQGWLYKPEGEGPFPAVIYNHGSDKVPGWFPTLGQFWTARGYVLFVPHRRGHGRSPGDWIVDLQRKFRETEKDETRAQKHDIELHERANADVVAAVAWLKLQPFVNTNALIMSGISYGGIQTVLAAEKDLSVKAFIAFAPAAMSWQGNPLLRERLLQAVKNAQTPMFLLQATNDYNLGPSELLGKELERKGPPNRAKVYPAYGDPADHQAGHGGFAVRGSEIWGADVMKFLGAVLERGGGGR